MSVDTLKEAKKALREKMKLIFAEHSGEDCSSALISLESRPEFIRAETVLMFMSLNDEVSTFEFINKWSRSKRIAIPLVEGTGLVLREYSPLLLEIGYQGILEPSAGSTELKPEDIDLAVVPGMAFDLDGHRLGRGKGFYDRLFPHLKCPKAGLCQRWRVVDEVPSEPWDGIVDFVCW